MAIAGINCCSTSRQHACTDLSGTCPILSGDVCNDFPCSTLFFYQTTTSAFLLIPLRPVMRPAQHLAVFQLCYAAFAPGGHMVGIHLERYKCSPVTRKYHFHYHSREHGYRFLTIRILNSPPATRIVSPSADIKLPSKVPLRTSFLFSLIITPLIKDEDLERYSFL